jgi:nuclear GTP-binding protein
MPKVGKPTSKRVSTRLHHNIKKKSAEKQRKDRKAAKKNPQWVSRLKKDPGIPNSYPFKAQVLAEIEEHKIRKEAEQQEKRDTAKARREGRSVVEVAPGPSGRAAAGAMEMDGDLVDMEGDEAMDDDNSNPMAALLASAQARALDHTDELDDEEDDDEEDDEEEAGQRPVEKKKAPAQKAVAVRKVLPKQALADPIKAVRALMENMQKTEDGVQKLVDFYQLAPIVTAHSDLPTRFLVDVARKRGRLGRGGVPNLHSAALVVLNDINEDRVRLPTVRETKKVGPKGKSQITIVQTMAEPFKIAGLWGDDNGAADAMAVEA